MSMGQELTVAVQEAINKHLPGEIGALLRQRLVDAEQDRVKIVSLTKMIKERDERIESLSSAVRDESSINERLTKLGAAEKKVAAEQLLIDHKIELATLRKECAVQTKEDIKELVATIFRSPITREIIVDSKQIPVINTQGGYQTGTATETHTHTHTKTTDGPGADPSNPQLRV